MTRSKPVAALAVVLALALASCTHAAIGNNCNTDDDCFDTTAQGYCDPRVNTPGYLGRCAACNKACNTCAGPDTDDCTSCAPQNSNASRATNRCPSDFTPVPARTTKGTCASCAPSAPASACVDSICPGFFFTPAPIGGSSSCTECDASCTTCNGPSATQCTSCPADTFLTPGSTSGSGACLACQSQDVATTCSKTNCPAFYFVPTAGQGGLGQCLPCDASCATCNGPASNQCTSCPTPADTDAARQQRTFLSFSGAGAGAGSGTCASCISASQAACTTANCPGFFYANQDPNSNGICVPCSLLGSAAVNDNIAFCNAQNCPNFFISQTLGQPNSAMQSCFNCSVANTPGECSPANCPSYTLNTQGATTTNDDTCDLKVATPAPTAAPTSAPTTAPTAPTAMPTAPTTAPSTPTFGPTPGPIPASCPAAEYRAPGGCAKCVSSSSPFKQRLGGYSCLNAVTSSDTSTTCIPITLKAYPRKVGTSATKDTCIRQSAAGNIIGVLLETKDTSVPFLTSASYVKGSLRLNNVAPTKTSTGQVVFVEKGDLRLVQFDDRFRAIRAHAPKQIFLTGVLRPYVGATTNLRCFRASLQVCA